MINLKSLPKKKLKIILCGVGILAAMSVLATVPPLSHDSAVKPAGAAKAAALNAPAAQAGSQAAEANSGTADLTASPTGSSSLANGYSLQGTAAAGNQSSAPQSAGSGSAGSAVSPTPVSEPDVLYPVDPAPKCAYYYKPGTMMPYSCPLCEAMPSADGTAPYPCGGCYGGKLGIMCANPY